MHRYTDRQTDTYNMYVCTSHIRIHIIIGLHSAYFKAIRATNPPKFLDSIIKTCVIKVCLKFSISLVVDITAGI